MSADTQNIGVGTTIIVDDIPVTFQASFNSTALSIEVESCKFDLVKTTKERFNDLNVIIPEGSSELFIAKFSGAISKTDKQKTLSPNGEYRLIEFNGEMEKIAIPIPIISDISIDKAFFYYQYLSAASTSTESNFKDQVIFIGCRLSVKEGTNLSKALTGATLRAAYFLSNNASIVYFDFSGKIDVGNIIEAIFGITTTNLTIDVKSAGIFRIAKTNTQKTIPGKDGKPDTTAPEVTYLDALKQLASLQKKSEEPVDSDVTKYMPSTFPLGEKQVMVNGSQVTKMGIQVGNDIDTDFPAQFSEAFSGDSVTGICFWVMIDFNKITLFQSLITIGYSNEQVNSLILYGFKTQSGKTQETQETQKTPETISSAYFYAQLPTATILDFLTLGGLNGRQGILFKYTTNNNQYELNGSLTFTAFKKEFVFGGDLLINNDVLTATLDLTAGSSNNSIREPLGMTGINFGELYLSINKTFAKKATDKQPEVKAKLDLAIGGFIDFNFNGIKLQLQGNVVFQDSEARLVLVSLNATPALTLNNFVKEVIKKPWDWIDDITKQIGFISGTMYYLSKPASQKDNKDYTFAYTNPLQINSGQEEGLTTITNVPNAITVFKPGYHIHANLLLFEKYVFVIDLNVESAGVNVNGSYGGTYENNKITESSTITAYFISLESPTLAISTVGGANFEIVINKLKLFGTDIGSFKAKYGNGVFKGSYSYSNPHFGFDWEWTKKQGSRAGGFSITKIDGIQIKELNAITDMVKKLNSMSGKGGCESIANSMFGEFKSSFSPALEKGKSPKDNGNGTMNTPLEINYKFSIGSTTILSDSIKMTLDIEIPKSLSGLPIAIIDTLGLNMGTIVEQLLGNPTVYKVIALEMAKRGGAKLAARMLCRAAEEVAEKLAEELAAALAEGLIEAGLESLLELGAVLTGVLAAGIAGAVGGLLGILQEVWDAIKKIFGGDDGKQEAQDKLDSIKRPVQQLMSSLNSSLDKMADSIQVQSLKASIDSQGYYNLNWNFPTTADLGANGMLEYKLNFLNGAIGTAGTQSKIPAVGFVLMKDTSYKMEWSKMLEADPDFSMNASIQTSITGYNFMTAEAERSLRSTISTLNEIGNNLDGAVAFNNELKRFVEKMKVYNTYGLTSGVVHTTQSSEANQFKIGQGALGINTKIT